MINERARNVLGLAWSGACFCAQLITKILFISHPDISGPFNGPDTLQEMYWPPCIGGSNCAPLLVN